MKKLPDSHDSIINPESEIQAIVAYLEATWDLESLTLTSGPSDASPIRTLVETAFVAGYQALPEAMNESVLSTALLDAGDKREQALATQSGWGREFPLHDGLLSSYNFMRDAAFWERENQRNAHNKALQNALADLGQRIQEHYMGLAGLFPLGYAEFTQNYRDYAGMSDLDETHLTDQFDGHDASSAGAMELPIRLSLPHVAYDDHAQGRPPEEVLLNTIFSQGLGLRTYNNTVEFLRELSTFANPDQPFAINLHVPGMTLPRMAHLWDAVDSDSLARFEPLTEESAAHMRAKKAEFDALSPEEKAKRQKASAARILNMLEGMGPS